MRGWVAKSGVQQICYKKTLTVEDWWMISYQKRRAWSGLKLFEVHGIDKAFRFYVSLGEQSPPM